MLPRPQVATGVLAARLAHLGLGEHHGPVDMQPGRVAPLHGLFEQAGRKQPRFDGDVGLTRGRDAVERGAGGVQLDVDDLVGLEVDPHARLGGLRVADELAVDHTADVAVLVGDDGHGLAVKRPQRYRLGPEPSDLDKGVTEDQSVGYHPAHQLADVVARVDIVEQGLYAALSRAEG